MTPVIHSKISGTSNPKANKHNFDVKVDLQQQKNQIKFKQIKDTVKVYL